MLHTLFPLLGYLDDQHGEFLKIWLEFHGFGELPDLIEYYTTIGNCTPCTTIENPTLLKDHDYLVYPPINCMVDDRSIVGGVQRIETPDGYVFPLSIELTCFYNKRVYKWVTTLLFNR